MASEPMRIPLAIQPSNRGQYAGAVSKDAKLVNGYLEKDPSTGEMWTRKRGGMKDQGAAAGTNGRGIYVWNGINYVIDGGQLYSMSVLSTPVFSAKGAVDGTFGTRYVWSTALKGTTPYIYFSNAVGAYWFDGTTLTAASGANFPAMGGRGFSVFLDGTLYVLGTDNYIYGSAIYDLTTWTDTTNKILCAEAGDLAYAIMRHGNYIIAFKRYSTDAYWDAGNPTGSPLQVLQGAHSDIGLTRAYTLATVADDLFWVGQERGGGIHVYRMTNLRITKISNPAVDRLLRAMVTYNNCRAYPLTFGGNRFYVISQIDTGGSYPNGDITLAYCVETGTWSEFQDQAGAPFEFEDGVASYVVRSDGTETGETYLIRSSDGHVVYFDQDAYTDYDGQFALDVVTPVMDGKTLFNKTNARADLIADQVSAGSVDLRWSDDDYQNWSKYQTMDLSQEVPSVRGLGSFSKRAFQLHHKQDTHFRAKYLDLYLDKGTS